MRRYVIYSLLLHCLLIVAALWFIREYVKQSPPPFYARIVTPEELRTPPPKKVVVPPKRMQRLPEAPPTPQRETRTVIPRLPKDLPPPRELSAVPKSQRPPERTERVAQPEAQQERAASAHPLPKGDEPEGARKPSGLLEGTGTPAPSEEPQRKGPQQRAGKGGFKERFFDREVIGKLAHADKPKGGEEQPKTSNSITFDAADYRYYGYMQRLQERIESIWRYPSDAATRGIQGDLYIQFTIKRNGLLGAVELVRTSGNASLDEAALRAVRTAEPFWPLPETIKEDALTITGHFVYTLNGYYLR